MRRILRNLNGITWVQIFLCFSIAKQLRAPLKYIVDLLLRMTMRSKRMPSWDLKLTHGQSFTVMLCLIYQKAPLQIRTRGMIFVMIASTVAICTFCGLHKYLKNGFACFSRVARRAPSMAEFHPILESKIILNGRHEPWVSIIQGNASRWRSVKHTSAVACPHSCFRYFFT